MSPKPMLTEDYLIRQLNLAIAALATIIGFKTAGQYQAALFEIDQILEQLLGLKSYMIKNLADEGILAMVSTSDGVDTDRLLIVAELIKHEGDIYASKNYVADSLSSYKRALNFYLEVQLSGGPINLDSPDKQIEILLDRLSISNLPLETTYNLFLYYEKRGEFARAEGMLDQLQIAADSPEDLVPEYQRFYSRLREKSDHELVSGGVSRSQIIEKLNRLKR